MVTSDLADPFLGNQKARDKIFGDRPAFVSIWKLALVFVACLTSFFGLWCLKPELGFTTDPGVSLIITAHGGKPGKKGAWNDIQVYPMVSDDDYGGLVSAFGAKDTLGLLGADLRHRAEVANPRGLHLYKSNTSLPDDPPGLFLLQAWRDHSKILYYPNACERHGDTLEVWKDLKGTGCVHPYDINIVNERVYLLCQTSHNVYYYNLHDPDQDGVFVGSFDQPRGIATSTLRNWIYIAERDNDQIVVKDIVKNTTIGHVKTALRPIGVVLSPDQTTLYIGERNTGRINFHDAETFEHKGYFAHDHIKHPAGLAIDNGYLYVVCQKNNHVVAVNLANGDAHIAVKHIQTRSENMRVLPCLP